MVQQPFPSLKDNLSPCFLLGLSLIPDTSQQDSGVPSTLTAQCPLLISAGAWKHLLQLLEPELSLQFSNLTRGWRSGQVSPQPHAYHSWPSPFVPHWLTWGQLSAIPSAGQRQLLSHFGPRVPWGFLLEYFPSTRFNIQAFVLVFDFLSRIF